MAPSQKVVITKLKKIFEIDDKRFHLPYKIEYECPKCHRKCQIDLSRGDDYLAYPMTDRPFDHTLYCPDCDHEWEIKLQLNLELVRVT